MSRQNSFVIGADHPSLPGHFPGEPIVPGAVLLDHAIAHIESSTRRRVAGIGAAKFYLPVLPDKTCIMTLQVKGDVVSLSATVDGDVAFSLSAQLQDGPFDDGQEQEPA
jgi:3-hydroxymyristoyl/3-hydroxydecanoyl-(acyl carrier protein) dehydratase